MPYHWRNHKLLHVPFLSIFSQGPVAIVCYRFLDLESVEMTQLNGRVEDCENHYHQSKLKENLKTLPPQPFNVSLGWGGV